MPKEWDKRLIEITFPINGISESCVKEKSIRHGHISTLQQWWARRPLAICRTAIFASLCPSPNEIDELPEIGKLLEDFFPDKKDTKSRLDQLVEELSSWKTHQNENLLALANKIIRIKYDSPPLIVDTFAGGGSFPIEALRLGLETAAADLNPVATTALRLAVEYLPGSEDRIIQQYLSTAKKLEHSINDAVSSLYQRNKENKEQVLAFFWCKTYLCPNCFLEVPLLQSYWLAKGRRKVAVRLKFNQTLNKFFFEIYSPASSKEDNEASKGTMQERAAVCPICSCKVTTTVLRQQGEQGQLGDKLYAKLTLNHEGKRIYSNTNGEDEFLAHNCKLRDIPGRKLKDLPNEPFDKNGIRHTWMIQYGISTFNSLYNHRQGIALLEVLYELEQIKIELLNKAENREIIKPLLILLNLTFNRLVIYGTRHAWWQSNGEFPANMFVRQAIPMVWNYVEIPLNSCGAAGWKSSVQWIERVSRHLAKLPKPGTVWQGDAASCPLADAVADLVTVDPPYYDSIAYSYLADVFYVWMKIFLGDIFPKDFFDLLSPKKDEAIVDRPHRLAPSPKTDGHFRMKMTQAFLEARRILKPNGRLLIMFGHKKVEAWDALLSAIIDAGFRLTVSYPIHTERKAKFRHGHIDALSSSCLIVCLPEKFSIKEKIVWNDFERNLKNHLKKLIVVFESAYFFGSDLLASLIVPACVLFKENEVLDDAAQPLSLNYLVKKLPKIVVKCELEILIDYLNELGEENSLVMLKDFVEKWVSLDENFISDISWLTLNSENSVFASAVHYSQSLYSGDTNRADELWNQLIESDRKILCYFFRIVALLSPESSMERQLAHASLGRISLKIRT